VSGVWGKEEDLRAKLHASSSHVGATLRVTGLRGASEMIGVIASIVVLIAAVSVAFFLTVIDSLVHHQLYQFGLKFSYEWANPYWTALRISLALLGVIAVISSLNITHFLWNRLKRPRVMGEAEEAETVSQDTEIGVPSLFECPSCGRSITHPIRMLDFHSQRPKMINICPFCNATVVPVTHIRTERTGPIEEEIKEQR